MPPSIIDQIREQQAWEQPKKSGSAGFIVGTIAAFGAGVIGVVAWGGLPALSIKGLTAGQPKTVAAVTHLTPSAPPVAAKQPEISISTKGRIGNASESKLLRTCLPADFRDMGDGNMQPKDIYRMLQIGSQMSRIANIAKIKQDAVDETEFAGLWAEVADCVYRQNGWMLCDPDNRALAVEAVSTLTRLAGVASAKPAAAKDPNGAPRTFAQARAEVDGRRAPAAQQKLQSVRSVKERVLATLKMRAQEGRFVASDFGVLAHAEVMQVMKDTKPTSDACANKS
jgi:hypothetical protein